MRMDPPPLVSVVIPCYNAERWVREAVQSCLDQTYPKIEVIVVDDGSTDGSLQVLDHFDDSITVIRTEHAGGNHARNLGFSVSRGEFIQFLDADDYLLPEKIERQVACMLETDADVVYGDWRHLIHYPDKPAEFQPARISGPHEDMLESLLANRWVAPCAILHRRSIIERVKGWDETLESAQDRDLFTRIALFGAQIRYQPGCLAIYRRYGNVTVSTRDPRGARISTRRVLDRAEQILEERGLDNARYRRALAVSYLAIARATYDDDVHEYRELLSKALQLDPKVSRHGSYTFHFVAQVLGYERADRVAAARRSLISKLSHWGRLSRHLGVRIP
jgi:glycosyltransferase involved in cell wall biosynthesis